MSKRAMDTVIAFPKFLGLMTGVSYVSQSTKGGPVTLHYTDNTSLTASYIGKIAADDNPFAIVGTVQHNATVDELKGQTATA